jgi:hypothetical protein
MVSSTCNAVERYIAFSSFEIHDIMNWQPLFPLRFDGLGSATVLTLGF